MSEAVAIVQGTGRACRATAAISSRGAMAVPYLPGFVAEGRDDLLKRCQ